MSLVRVQTARPTLAQNLNQLFASVRILCGPFEIRLISKATMVVITVRALISLLRTHAAPPSNSRTCCLPQGLLDGVRASRQPCFAGGAGGHALRGAHVLLHQCRRYL